MNDPLTNITDTDRINFLKSNKKNLERYANKWCLNGNELNETIREAIDAEIYKTAVAERRSHDRSFG